MAARRFGSCSGAGRARLQWQTARLNADAHGRAFRTKARGPEGARNDAGGSGTGPWAG
ncbi:hypothetical protein C4K26_2434 [Pseudomonas chlororaphis]|nr:hypothetical protein C4K26_2434 [Pseudomonas chlororaphis]